jgi:hypothetical protein
LRKPDPVLRRHCVVNDHRQLLWQHTSGKRRQAEPPRQWSPSPLFADKLIQMRANPHRAQRRHCGIML